MRKVCFAILGLSVIMLSCSDEKKLSQLQSKIDSLENELDDCKNGEDRLIGEIRNYYNSKNYKEASATYTRLFNKHPGSQYINEAKDIFEKSNKEIKLIQEASEKKKIAEQERKKLSLTKLKKRYDDIDDITWYKQNYFTHYTNSNKTSLEMGHRKGSAPWLVLMMSYNGEDWIFFDNAYLSYDGNTKEIYFDDYRDKKSENDGGEVWEWIKVGVDENMINWLKDFASSPKAKMRLTGKYEKTRNLTSQERQGMLDIIAGYEYLKENK